MERYPKRIRDGTVEHGARNAVLTIPAGDRFGRIDRGTTPIGREGWH
jgi:hypothetical protein